MAFLITAIASGAAAALRDYLMVMNDQVVMHPALPWRPDVRFALASASVTARGCNVWADRYGVYHGIIFRVRAPDGETLNLGDPLGHDVGTWLAVMRDYDNGKLPLPGQTNVITSHDPDCISHLLRGLDERQADELTRILS